MIGIPKSFFYYLYGNKWELYFKILNIKYILSPDTNKSIIELGNKYSNDEMCLSLKNYIGHIAYLKDKCDYILVPRIDNYGIDDQMCTNFIAIYDIVNNIFDIDIISYNIDLLKKETLEKGLIKIGMMFGNSKKKCLRAYKETNIIINKLNEMKIKNNLENLNTNNKKILLVSHEYIIEDTYIGKQFIKIIEDNNINIIYSHLFNKEKTNKEAYKLSKTLYWKYSKEMIGCITDTKVDGIIFISSFPCGLDSLVNELVMRNIKIPYLNIIVDDMSSLSGFETRIESFVDLIKERK